MFGVMVLLLAVIARAENLEATYATLQGAQPQVVVAALESGDSFARELALAQIARENRAPELTRAAADAVATVRQPGVRAQLIAVLAERGDASAAPAVRKALTDADPAVRAAAVEACAMLKDSKAADALFEMLGGEQGESARGALCRIPGKAIDARLVSLLGKGKGSRRVMAVELLAARRYEGLLPLLLDKRLFESGDMALSKAVAGAIRVYAPSDGFDTMLAFTLSLSAPAAELLAGTLTLTLGEAADKPACERAVEKALLSCNAAHAPMLTGLLAASQGAGALRVFSKRLESGDLEVRKEAIRSLGKWNGEAALVPLVLAAKRERDAGAQTLAWRAVIESASRSDKIVDFYQPVSAIHQAVWYAPRREEKVAALWVLPRYHPKSWEVEWLLTKVETEKPEIADEARRVKNALVPPCSGWLGR
jgi:HEAT repeat protein